MDSDDQYDEFGNYIGDVSGSEEEISNERSAGTSEAVDEQQHQHTEEEHDETNGTQVATANAYKTVVMHPYEQPTDKPVIEPVVERRIKIDYNSSLDYINEDSLPQLKYSREYMLSTMNSLPARVRNVAVVGNLHSGKTTFIDSLVSQTHNLTKTSNVKTLKPLRYMDNHKLEIDRGISIKTSPITLLLQDSKETSFVFNLLDTPGHFDFSDEVSAALTAVEGAILVIDVVEGLTQRDRSLITKSMRNDIPFIIMLNKIDRLVTELRMPVADSYYKLKYIVDAVNEFVANDEFSTTYSHPKVFSPALNNVVFASSSLGFNFTLRSFAKLYLSNRNSKDLDSEVFTKMLWGDVYYDERKELFTKAASSNNKRTFEVFILEPIYKIITHTLTNTSDENSLAKILWNNFGVKLLKSQYKQDIQILLRDVFNAIFVDSSGLVEAVVANFPSPEGAQSALEIANKLPHDSLLAHVVKLVETADASKFYTLLRIYNGTLKVGSKVKVFGHNFMEDDDDFKLETVEEIFLPGGRYRVPIEQASKGSLVLVSGIDTIITKSATVFGATQDNSKVNIVPTENYSNTSVFKVAVEPANPSELPKLLAGLRKVNKSYLASVISVEESGEHVILGPGEMYLDCVLHDLRLYFTEDLQIRVSEPMIKFSETCADTSITSITTKSASGENQLSIIAEPIEDAKLSHAITIKKINLAQPLKVTSRILRNDFGWDALAARSIWYFGPEDMISPSILVDDTLEDETDKKLLYSVKESINLGFKWSVNEGPLCGEPIRDTKFKILDAVIGGSEVQRSNTQLIPLARRACYTALLTASPRLMEPIYNFYATATEKSMRVVTKLISDRRGYIQSQLPIAGTQLFEMQGQVPVIESVGLETDIRFHSQGQAMCFLDFSHWDVVPGDPLDTECELPQLKPVPTESLARDFVLKTRKRKGLTGDVSLQKYIEPELYQKLKENGIVR